MGNSIRPDFFPESVRRFPRCTWDYSYLGGGCHQSDDLGGRAQWAARAASLRWLAAIKNNEIGDLDYIDFGLAVFDMVVNQNIWLRKRRCESGRVFRTGQQWMEESDKFIEHAHQVCYQAVSRHFPNSDKLQDFADYERYYVFLYQALEVTWTNADSWGVPEFRGPHLTQEDIRRWVGRYSPEWKSLFPVLATAVDLESPVDSNGERKTTLVWLDENYDEVDPPAGWVHPDERKSEEAEVGSSSSSSASSDEPAELGPLEDMAHALSRHTSPAAKDISYPATASELRPRPVE